MKTTETRIVRLTGVNQRGDRAVVRRDKKDPSRIFASFPSFVSMTPEEVVDLANALVDALEEDPENV